MLGKGIMDRRIGKYIKPLYMFLTYSRNSPNHMRKTIFNNLSNDVESIKILCDNQFNNTNDIVNKNNPITLYYNIIKYIILFTLIVNNIMYLTS
jgi:hypothetical protein